MGPPPLLHDDKDDGDGRLLFCSSVASNTMTAAGCFCFVTRVTHGIIAALGGGGGAGGARDTDGNDDDDDDDVVPLVDDYTDDGNNSNAGVALSGRGIELMSVRM
mmetsp:Transcript_10042/g.13127  ORF Transcript_10042/g.13127 Transcript_10042/m.13127 type:complete len:105 (-) Transcript_10042:483-797(-)